MANEAEIPFTLPVPGSAADRYFRDIIQKAVEETAIELAQTFVTEEAVSAITKRSIPWSLRDVDHQTVGGIYAQLGPGGTMIYGGAPEMAGKWIQIELCIDDVISYLWVWAKKDPTETPDE